MHRSIVLSVAAMTFGIGTMCAMAQQGPAGGDGRRPAPMMMGGGIERQLEELNLTEEQKKQIEPILQDMRDKMRQATQDARDKVNKVLTEEQQAQLRERSADRGPQGFDPVQRMERSLEGLDLTTEQKTKVQEIFAKFRPEFEAVRTESAGDRQAMMEGMRPLLQDLRSQVTAVLTPEQTQKLQERMGGQGREGRRGGDEAQSPERRERPRGNREGRERN